MLMPVAFLPTEGIDFMLMFKYFKYSYRLDYLHSKSIYKRLFCIIVFQIYYISCFIPINIYLGLVTFLKSPAIDVIDLELKIGLSKNAKGLLEAARWRP
jgi:hypothetical protein